MDTVFEQLMEERTIICPNCRGPLELFSLQTIQCTLCLKSYPIANGVPILLHDGSAFTPEQVMTSRRTYFAKRASENPLKRKVRQALPSLANEYTRAKVDDLVRSN